MTVGMNFIESPREEWQEDIPSASTSSWATFSVHPFVSSQKFTKFLLGSNGCSMRIKTLHPKSRESPKPGGLGQKDNTQTLLVGKR